MDSKLLKLVEHANKLVQLPNTVQGFANIMESPVHYAVNQLSDTRSKNAFIDSYKKIVEAHSLLLRNQSVDPRFVQISRSPFYDSNFHFEFANLGVSSTWLLKRICAMQQSHIATVVIQNNRNNRQVENDKTKATRRAVEGQRHGHTTGRVLLKGNILVVFFILFATQSFTILVFIVKVRKLFSKLIVLVFHLATYLYYKTVFQLGSLYFFEKISVCLNLLNYFGK